MISKSRVELSEFIDVNAESVVSSNDSSNSLTYF
jgi:hypothetical protein